MDLSVPSILPPQVWLPSTPSMLLSIYIWIVMCRNDENKQQISRYWPNFEEFQTFFNWPLAASFYFRLFNRKLEIGRWLNSNCVQLPNSSNYAKVSSKFCKYIQKYCLILKMFPNLVTITKTLRRVGTAIYCYRRH